MNTSNPSNDSNNSKPTPNRERAGAGSSAQKRNEIISQRENVQYRYAFDEAGKTVDVLTLKDRHSGGQQFRCLGCRELMVARLGEQLAHHFAHKSNSHCSGETYLHQLAKQVFREEFELCLAQNKAFQIELPQRWVCDHHGAASAQICHTQAKLQVYDLVPDLTLVGRQGKPDIWVEMAVTHRCSSAKLKAGRRIIEISIQREADVELFRQRKLSAQDPRVKFIHFPERVPKDMCHWYEHCRLKKRVILIYPDGRLEIQYLEKHQALSMTVQSKVVHWLEEFVHCGDVPVTLADYTALVREATERCQAAVRAAGCEIRACGLCVHYDRAGEAGCQKYGTPVPWERALECPDFSVTDDASELPDEVG